MDRNGGPAWAEYAAGAKPADKIQAIVKSTAQAGVSQGYVPNLNENGCVRGQALYGMTRDALHQFADDNDCLWSIQDGQLTLIPQTAYIPGEAPVISRATGLIGVPEQTRNGIEVRTLLNPSLKIGRLVKIDSTINRYRFGLDNQSQGVSGTEEKGGLAAAIKLNADGLYYVISADHSGDTRGNEWYTDLTCLAVDATVPMGWAPQGAISPSAASLPRY